MNDKKSYEELDKEIKSAEKLVIPGRRYAHYKQAETPYVVKGMVIIEATNEIAVRYSSLASEKIEFVRPLKVWLETVEWKGKTIQRFTLIDDLEELS